jgi:hypothetical protein
VKDSQTCLIHRLLFIVLCDLLCICRSLILDSRILDSSVSIVTRLLAGRPGFDSRQGQGIFVFATACIPGRVPPSLLCNGYRGVKRPGREANHLPPCSAEVKNVWSYASTPPYVFMAWCLVKYKVKSSWSDT